MFGRSHKKHDYGQNYGHGYGYDNLGYQPNAQRHPAYDSSSSLGDPGVGSSYPGRLDSSHLGAAAGSKQFATATSFADKGTCASGCASLPLARRC